MGIYSTVVLSVDCRAISAPVPAFTPSLTLFHTLLFLQYFALSAPGFPWGASSLAAVPSCRLHWGSLGLTSLGSQPCHLDSIQRTQRKVMHAAGSNQHRRVAHTGIYLPSALTVGGTNSTYSVTVGQVAAGGFHSALEQGKSLSSCSPMNPATCFTHEEHIQVLLEPQSIKCL